MPRAAKSLIQMNADSLRYLAENTNITYLSEGSRARALVESANLEISRLNEFLVSTWTNQFINTAQGQYLDLIGEMLGVTRLGKGSGSTSAEDESVQFSVATGTLGDNFPNPSNANTGLIPAGLQIQTADGSIKYTVPETVEFPSALTEVFVAVVSVDTGTAVNVGKGRLIIHDGPAGVSVTNLKSITNGTNVESDADYRFRLANSTAGKASCNAIGVKLSLAGLPDVASIRLREFARGAGTFDALLVPIGNTLSSNVAEIARQSLEASSAFGVSSRVIEPIYIRFRLSVQLIPIAGTGAGTVDANKLTAKNAILDYFDSIPIGGEFIVNRVRAAIIDAVTDDIKDMRILDLCINGRPRVIRNIKLKPDQLFTPDRVQGQAILIV